MSRRYVYEAIIEPDEDAYLYVHFPDLPDAFTQARSLEEAAVNAAETLELALMDYLADGDEPPAPVFGHAHSPGDRMLLVSVEMDRLLG